MLFLPPPSLFSFYRSNYYRLLFCLPWLAASPLYNSPGKPCVSFLEKIGGSADDPAGTTVEAGITSSRTFHGDTSSTTTEAGRPGATDENEAGAVSDAYPRNWSGR